MGDSMKVIGEVELLRERAYPLDAECGPAGQHVYTEVVVPPGTYPLYGDGLTTFIVFTGLPNIGRVFRLGDGLMTAQTADVVDTDWPEVTFMSRRWGPDEWEDFTADPMCAPGPEQRMRISLRNAPLGDDVPPPNCPLCGSPVRAQRGRISDIHSMDRPCDNKWHETEPVVTTDPVTETEIGRSK